MNTPHDSLEEFCKASLAREVPHDLHVMANVLRQRHAGIVAILAYGSCLRGVAVTDTLMDFYVLTESLANVSPNFLSRLGCAIAPPNVHYVETELGGQRLRAKYALLPLSLFAKWTARNINNPYFWARFAQPSALLYARDEQARLRVATAISAALRTCYANAKGLATKTDPASVWTAGFGETYRSELRSERTNRAASIVAAEPGYYAQAARLLEHEPALHANQGLRRLAGKGWSVLRLCKAAFTFQGSADYIVWKIERHSGEKIILSPWQRRHPIFAGLMLLPAMLRKGAVR